MFFWYGTLTVELVFHLQIVRILLYQAETWSLSPEVFFWKVFLKIYSKFTREHPCQSEITLRHGCSHLNSLYIFTTPFAKNTTRGLLLFYVIWGTIVSCFHFSTLDFFNLWTSKSSYYYAISLTTLLNSSTCKCTIFQMRLFAINHYYNVFFLSF